MKALQDQLFVTALAAVQQTETAAADITDRQSLVALLTKTSAEQATLVVDGWKALLPQLITK